MSTSDAALTRSDAAPDAVVVGAGHNGLVAATLLADAGWDVVVCEATGTAGGAVRSAEVTAPGYVNDLFSAFYPLAVASPVLRGLELDRHGLTWCHAPSVLAHVLPDGRSVTLSRDVEATAKSVAQFAAADGDAWLQLVDQWQAIRVDVLDALLHPFPPVRAASRLLRTLGAGDMARFARMAVLPARRMGEEFFAGEGARILIAGCAMHADIGIDNAASAIYGWLLTMLGQSYGFPVPRGGAGSLATALCNRLNAAGGTIRLGAPVDEILLDSGSAVGVRLIDGETVPARRAVLADVNAPVLYRELVGIERLPSRFVDDLQRFQWDAPTLKVDWALSSPIPWADEEVRGAGTVHLGVDMDGLTTFSADLARRRVPREPLVLFGQMTTSDPSRSPAGTEAAWGYTHLPPGRDDLTEDEIAAHVDVLEGIVERHAPGFARSIVARYVQSPATLRENNPNLRHGAINGGTAQVHQQLIFRPTVGLAGASTPIDRLFLAGSSAHPGGGVHGAAGANAAHAALRHAGRGGWAYRRMRGVVNRSLYGST